MNKKYILKSWNLIKDAMNPNNSDIVHLAIDNLFDRIEMNEMECLEDYISFKDEWYIVMKNN
ncbi:hypothetical protein M0Q97_01860 [Candidatus Dojkabacteria bacterium]|jgi:hypothetical protein|nr:hypothetical protein [Candidatus Dojkabacteria bacterium]